MKVGNYVRTKDGKIFKIENINEYYIYVLDTKCSLSEDDKTCFYMPNKDEPYKIVKSSPNIMDLIEENDYIRTINDTDFRRVYMSYGKLVIYKYDEEIPIETFSNKFIGGIITSEQFSQMEYKVGE